MEDIRRGMSLTGLLQECNNRRHIIIVDLKNELKETNRRGERCDTDFRTFRRDR